MNLQIIVKQNLILVITLILYNNPFYELEKNSEKIDKSFMHIKNGLKYLIDKNERVTESYLMALNGGEINDTKNDKKLYLPTHSIIEEEKSEFFESTSKKATLVNNKLFKENKEIHMNFENKINNNENKENVDKNKINENVGRTPNKLSLNLFSLFFFNIKYPLNTISILLLVCIFCSEIISFIL